MCVRARTCVFFGNGRSGTVNFDALVDQEQEGKSLKILPVRVDIGLPSPFSAAAASSDAKDDTLTNLISRRVTAACPDCGETYPSPTISNDLSSSSGENVVHTVKFISALLLLYCWDDDSGDDRSRR